MKEIKFTLTEEDLKILDEALIQLPYYKVAELIGKLNEQISEKVVEPNYVVDEKGHENKK